MSQRLKKAFSKAGCNLYHKSWNKLQNLLCGKNKSRPDPCECKGIYKFHCPCKPTSIYVGETKRSINTRAAEHKKAVEKEQWSHSGLSQHKKECNVTMDWKPEVLSRPAIKNPQQLKHHLRVEEALWIRRLNCGPGKGLNEDYGSYVRTDAWQPIFNTM